MNECSAEIVIRMSLLVMLVAVPTIMSVVGRVSVMMVVVVAQQKCETIALPRRGTTIAKPKID
jgi:hypothetical protein